MYVIVDNKKKTVGKPIELINCYFIFGLCHIELRIKISLKWRLNINIIATQKEEPHTNIYTFANENEHVFFNSTSFTLLIV